jgi:peptidoglycan/LPS O-acetylase OafA/YrhL
METDLSRAPGWLTRGQIPSLDGMRAISILLVVAAHAAGTRGFPQFPFLGVIAREGGVGVEVFFVISGFLITTLMLREVARTGGVHIGGFYYRRVLRILPAYACLLAVVAALQLLGAVQVAGRDWLAALTYTMNFLPVRGKELGHVWSLSIEEHFYLIWPLLMAFAGEKVGRRAAAACLVLCPAIRWAVMLAFPAYSPMTSEWTFTRIDTIAAGCLLALLAWDPAWRKWLDRLVADNRVVALVFAVLVGSVFIRGVSGKLGVGVGYSTAAVSIGLLLWAALRRADSLPGRVLNWGPVRAVGLLSYSLYLWQQLFLQRPGSDFTCVFPLNVGLAFLTAYLSYRLIETPIAALKTKALAPAPAPRVEVAVA